MYCINCGKYVDEKLERCEHCGHKNIKISKQNKRFDFSTVRSALVYVLSLFIISFFITFVKMPNTFAAFGERWLISHVILFFISVGFINNICKMEVFVVISGAVFALTSMLLYVIFW